MSKSLTEEVLATTGEILAGLGTSGSARPERGSSVLFRLSSSIKKVHWTPTVDIIVTSIQKIVGSTGNLIVSLQDLSSANITQWSAGQLLHGSIIYADNAVSSATDPIGGLSPRFAVKANTKIFVWYETSAEGGVLMHYVFDIANI